MIQAVCVQKEDLGTSVNFGISKMERIGVPVALVLRSVKVTDFEMYSGSKKGAVSQDLSDVCPSDFWADEILEIDTLYKDTVLLFYDDGWLRVMPYNDTFRYRQVRDCIEIYIEEKRAWVPFAYGCREKLTLKLGLLYFRKMGLFNKANKLMQNCDQNCASAFRYAKIPSMDLFKDHRSKIVWCNMHYVFY